MGEEREMKKRWLDNTLFIVGMMLVVTLIPLVLIRGITPLVGFLSIMFVLDGGIYLGYKLKRA